jgi:hypothetical protein
LGISIFGNLMHHAYSTRPPYLYSIFLLITRTY